ncbi:nicotinate-nucleotide adenylyltransferase [Pseudomonadales bacterium]|jgi:nicotinate-nucleotide adenylyltransferase|nr:nicotinate-nucleotide adenylyltransferase [Gammaproteobacteria bacterium]MBT3900458.1 nicotinate-nucleotide adenylyltransferase [Gammaproteobacteria bacterium]MBT7541193.1 nicotinate-nucleotide adenylyltransferase [Gammaproteobacteria bacterium]MDA7833022.1 nicotinate-nucleotide adenylyltransferase [Pseudomonadales bacterium]MDC1479359.1 nicotinate-nucleotide adenylyltransferase [Pseudomonadales bacterium]|tara:strand:+ start:644 stop:1288 length:645 start_codon:yes stop_codon:yes gene_type:complete
MSLALMGGTFDPVHVGHLRSAEEVASLLDFRTIRLIPSYIPPHRLLPGTSALQRLKMLKLAIKDNAQLEVDDREVRREGRSYSVDTLAEIRKEIGDVEPLCFVLGIDAFRLVEEWHRWRELTNYAHLIVMSRPEMNEHPRDQAMSEALNAWIESRKGELQDVSLTPAGSVCFIELTQLAVSSTSIREMVLARQSTRYLLPESVRNFIDENGLYR